LRRLPAARPDDAGRDEVFVTIVLDADDLVGPRAGALEARVRHLRILALAMRGAESTARFGAIAGRLLALRLGRRCRRRRSRGFCGAAAAAHAAAVALARAEAAPRRRDRHRLRPLAKHRDADHADIERAPGARRIRV